jgi:indole-3-glycerol phosphate synthase
MSTHAHNQPVDGPPGDFLARMVASSTQRWEEARAAEPFEDVWDRALDAPAPKALSLGDHGAFDIIAECKLRSPAEGALSQAGAGDGAQTLVRQAQAYAQGGACAISVLTEPTAFDGHIDHLRAVAQAVDAPVMCKDFLVADYQVVQARAAGASGVLLIVRALDDDDLFEMTDLALDLGMFALIEAFDAADLARLSRMLITRGRDLVPGTLLVGVNCRNLADLSIDPERFGQLRDAIPTGRPAVAESGLADAQDASRVARLGYDVALVGSALMRATDPAGALAGMLRAGREARA